MDQDSPHKPPRIQKFKGKGFAAIPNPVAQDANLSYLAKGILTYLLSRPPDWHFHYPDLQLHGTEKIGKIKAAVGELKIAGFVSITPERTHGKVKVWRWEVRSNPPEAVIPHSGRTPISKERVLQIKVCTAKTKKPRSEAQKRAWAKLNRSWDHGKLDGDIYRFRDNSPTKEQLSNHEETTKNLPG